MCATKSFPLYASQQDPGGPNSSRSGEQNQSVEYPGVRSPEKHRWSSEVPLIVLKGSPSSRISSLWHIIHHKSQGKCIPLGRWNFQVGRVLENSPGSLLGDKTIFETRGTNVPWLSSAVISNRYQPSPSVSKPKLFVFNTFPPYLSLKRQQLTLAKLELLVQSPPWECRFH